MKIPGDGASIPVRIGLVRAATIGKIDVGVVRPLAGNQGFRAVIRSKSPVGEAEGELPDHRGGPRPPFTFVRGRV